MVSSIGVGHARRYARRCACGLGWICAGALLAVLAACGDATCPGGSESVDGQCVPALQCGPGLVRKGNTCTLASGVEADGGIASQDASDDQPASQQGHQTQDAGELAHAADATDAASASEDAGSAAVDAASPVANEDAAVVDATVPEAPDACADYDCGSHGHCELAADAPRCACDLGFAGERCESCEPGLGLKGQSCVPACEADAAPNCGAHGTCVVDGDATQCVCEHPFAGATCAGCSTGFALQADGSCAPDCGDCGAHGYCDGSLTIPACACYPGYARDAHACNWLGDGTTGGVVNGKLAGGSGWQADHVTIASGTATFTPSGTGGDCELGELSQTITMPARNQSEQFVLEIGTSTTCTSTDPEACPPLLVQLGTSIVRVRVPGKAGGDVGIQKVCLGDVGYGGQIALSIRPGIAHITGPAAFQSVAFACNSTWPTITGVAVRPAGSDECAAPGAITNGGFDTTARWVLPTPDATISGGALNLAGNASAHVDMIAPTAVAVAGAALRVALRPVTQAGAVQVELDGMPLAIIRASVSDTRYVCLPDWALGTAHDLGLRAFSSAMVVESIGIVSESHCGDGAFDRGFERPLETGGWFVHAIGSPNVDVITDARAFAGDSILRARSTTLAALVLFPPGSAGHHAALELAGRTGTAEMRGNIQVIGSAPALNATTAIAGTAWAVTTLCTGRIWEGQLAQLIVTANASFASGSGTGTPEILLDEVGPSSSTLCP